TAIIRAPELAAICFLAVERDAVAGLNQRVHAVRVCPRDGDSDFAGRAGRQTVTGQAFPRCATIRGFEQPTAWSPAFSAPSVDFDWPHPGEQNARVVRVHRDVLTARV